MNLIDKINKSIDNSLEVYDAGKEAEHDVFWDSYQLNGIRKSYQSAFIGATGNAVGGWTDITFQPKYDMVIDGDSLYSCDNMFQYSKVVDLKGILERNGVRLDFSKAQRLYATFDRASIENFPEIDLSSCTRMYLTFQNNRMKDLTLLNIPEDCVFDRVFNGCYQLENLTLSGTIGQNGFDTSACTKLTKASITSIINALSDDTTGLTVKFSEAAVKNAFKKEYKNSVKLSQDPDENGFYEITLPYTSTSNNLSLKFSTKMDVQTYIGYKKEDNYGNVEIEWDPTVYDWVEGIENFKIQSETNDNCFYYMIKRTDGEPVLEEDLILIDEEDLSDWDDLIADKTNNWTISLQ